jgi:hypothetical protein
MKIPPPPLVQRGVRGDFHIKISMKPRGLKDSVTDFGLDRKSVSMKE